MQTRDGYLWLTTFDGLARFDGVHFTVFNKSNTPAITNNRFTALYEDRDGTLWAGADGGEVLAYRDGVFVAYAMPEATRGARRQFTRDAHDELMAVTGAGAYYLRGQGPTLAPPRYADARLKFTGALPARSGRLMRMACVSRGTDSKRSTRSRSIGARA